MATMYATKNPGKTKGTDVSEAAKLRYIQIQLPQVKKEDPRIVGPYDKYFSAYQ